MNRNLIPGTVCTDYGFTSTRNKYYSIGHTTKQDPKSKAKVYTVMSRNPRLVNLPKLRQDILRLHPKSRGNITYGSHPSYRNGKPEQHFFHVALTLN